MEKKQSPHRPGAQAEISEASDNAAQPGGGVNAIPALCATLHNGKPLQRRRAAEQLLELGEPGLAALGASLVAGDAPEEVASALGRAGTHGLRPLRAGLRHQKPAVRLASITGLVEAGPAATAAVPALAAALADRHARVRLTAADALGALAMNGAIGKHAQVIIPALVILFDDRPEIAEAAASTLAALGPAALPTLIAALESEEESLRIGAAMALALMNDSVLLAEAVPALIEALSDPLDEVRYWVALALGDAQAQEALLALERAAAAEPEPEARQAMYEAIDRLRETDG